MKPTLLSLRLLAVASLLATALALPAQAADAHPAVKRPFKLPPPAELSYAIKARHSGLNLEGEALVTWHTAGGKYQINVESRAMLLGKIQSSSSAGVIDAYGLAPLTAMEKRFRKSATTVTFNRANRTLNFSASTTTYPLKGGEQDRASITWQLASNARAAAKKFVAGSSWQYFVAGRTDAQAWNFKVGKTEKIATPFGTINAIKVARLLPPGSREQELDIWLAPSLEWYPVKLRFSEPDGEVIEQALQKITRK
jgi:hypothetical protein